MKTTENKRFRTTVVVVYSQSYSKRAVSFDTLEEAKKVVEEQRIKHPRSKYFNGYVFDAVENKNILV